MNTTKTKGKVSIMDQAIGNGLLNQSTDIVASRDEKSEPIRWLTNDLASVESSTHLDQIYGDCFGIVSRDKY